MTGEVAADAMEFGILRDEHVLAECLQDVGTCEKFAIGHFRATGEKVMHGDLEDLNVVSRFIAKVGLKRRLSALDHVEIEFGNRIKATALEEDGFFVEHIGSLPDFAIGAEERGIGKTEAHEF